MQEEREGAEDELEEVGVAFAAVEGKEGLGECCFGWRCSCVAIVVVLLERGGINSIWSGSVGGAVDLGWLMVFCRAMWCAVLQGFDVWIDWTVEGCFGDEEEDEWK